MLAGQAKIYYKRKVQADPNVFRRCEDVNCFVTSMFHGQENQEATLEYLDSLSLYDQVKKLESIVDALKAVRKAIVKHFNLVPKERQTEKD